jgi:deoxycytidine triphosphate deaminase
LLAYVGAPGQLGIGPSSSVARRGHSFTARWADAGWTGPQNSHKDSSLQSMAGTGAPGLL